MAEPLLTKDAINIAGHKLPLPLVGAIVGVLGIVVVLRARSQGATIASAGTTTAADPGSVGVLGLDQEAQLANLSQQLASIQQTLNPQATNPASTTPASSATPPWVLVSPQVTGTVAPLTSRRFPSIQSQSAQLKPL